MTNSENIKLAADHKRLEATRKLSQLFRIPDGYSCSGIDGLVGDIISAAILEVAAIQAKASESRSLDSPASAAAHSDVAPIPQALYSCMVARCAEEVQDKLRGSSSLAND